MFTAGVFLSLVYPIENNSIQSVINKELHVIFVQLGINTRCPKKKYTSLKSYIFVLRTEKSLNCVLFVRQNLNLNFETFSKSDKN